METLNPLFAPASTAAVYLHPHYDITFKHDTHVSRRDTHGLTEHCFGTPTEGPDPSNVLFVNFIEFGDLML